jgi:hypothetical protein
LFFTVVWHLQQLRVISSLKNSTMLPQLGHSISNTASKPHSYVLLPVHFLMMRPFGLAGHIGLQLPFFGKIDPAGFLHLGRGPFFQAHLFDQSQVEQLQVMRLGCGLVRVRVEVIAGIIIALKAKRKPFFFRAGVQATGHGIVGDFSFFIAAALARGLFIRNAEFFHDHVSGFRIAARFIQNALKTRQPTGRRHLLIVDIFHA